MVEDRSAVEAEDGLELDWNTDPIPTAEEKPLTVLDSKEQTAALFCVEELGVVPPPDTGWVPRDSKGGEEHTIDGSTQPEWWRNTENRDWIYHAAEDKYFHLPSNSLWERRSLDCADAAAEIYTTYFRVDAGALQALSHFAMSLDIGLMPLAFKAWVRFMRKKKDRHFGIPAPPSSPGKGRTSSSRAKSQVKVSSPKTSKPRESTDVLFYTSQMSVGTTSIPTRSVDPANGLVQGDDLACPPPSFIRLEVAAEVAPGNEQQSTVEADALKQSDKKGIASVNANSGSANAQDAQAKEDQPLASKNDRGKGLFCLRCFRSSKARARPQEKVGAIVQPEPTKQSLVETLASSADNEKPSQDREVHEESKSSPRQTVHTIPETSARPTIDTVERHMRKLESFLELVRKNPQRLVDHVDRRRQDKTTLGFIVV